jgi:Tol biopolymer transport system component
MKLKVLLTVALLPVLACSGDEGDSDVYKFDKSDFMPMHLVAGVKDPAWSPDGGTVVFTYMDDLWSIPPEGAEEATQLTTMSGKELYANWAPGESSNKLVFVNSDGSDSHVIYTLTPGGEPEEVGTFSEQIIHTSWSKDGSTILFMKLGNKAIFSIPAEGGEAAAIANSDGWSNTLLVAQGSRHDDSVVYVDIEQATYRINELAITGGEPSNIISFPPAQSLDAPYALDISYDGSYAAYCTEIDLGGGDAGYSLILVPVPYTGGGTIPLFPGWHSWRINNPSWSPDGTELALETPDGLYRVVLKL